MNKPSQPSEKALPPEPTDMRERFEEWAAREGFRIERRLAMYREEATDEVWRAWQAALASQQAASAASVAPTEPALAWAKAHPNAFVAELLASIQQAGSAAIDK